MLKINNMELNNNRISAIKNLVRNSNNSTTNQKILSKWKKTIANYYKYIVLNFDGTIRDKNDRNGPINSDIIQEICKIASYDNITVIIATGRKESGLKIVKKCFEKKEIELIMILGNGSGIITIPSIKKIYSGKSFKKEEIITINNCLTEECNIPEDKIHFDKNMIRIFYESENEAAELNKLIEP